MSTHNGKIGRLPKDLRDQINQRMEDGEAAGPILEWLNGLPEVQAIVATKFDNHPINEQNLSNWRAGGYQDWQRQEERLNLARLITKDAQELDTVSGGPGAAATIGKHLTTLLMLEFARVVHDVLPAVAEPMERWRHTEKFLRILSRIRHEDHRAARLEWEQKRSEFQRAKEPLAPEALRKSAAPTSAVPPAENSNRSEPLTAPNQATIQRDVQEVSKVLDLYPDIPEPYALNQGWSKQIKVNQGKSR